MKQGPLTENELIWLDDILEKYGNEQSIIDVSELDGYLTALLSSPRVLEPEQWLVAVWGSEAQVPAWNSRERDRFMDLTFQHMADIDQRLTEYPEQFEPLFGKQEFEGQEFTVIDDWCYGYLRGVKLADWPALPDSLQSAFELIALHGNEENSEKVTQLTPEQFTADIEALPAASLTLHRFWLIYAEKNAPQPIIQSVNIGRNDPCPCGSGKKFKQCCLH